MNDHVKKLNEAIANYTERGKSYLNEAKMTQDNGYKYYPLAIQEFVLAYKHALLLNGDHPTERSCLFNLGASYIAGGYSARGIDVLNNILKFTPNEVPDSHPRKGDILFNIALAYDKMKEYDNAMKYYQESLIQYRIEFTSFSPLLCEAMISLGKVYVVKQDFMNARPLFAEAANRFVEHEEFASACRALLCKVDTMITDGSPVNPECSKVLEDCLELALKIKNKDNQSKVMNDIGLKLTLICEYENALKCFGAALRLCGKDKYRRALTLQNMGAIYNRLRKYKMAIPLHNECIEIHGELNNRNAQGQCFCNLAFAESQLHRYEAAWESYTHALRAFKDTGDTSGQWQVCEGLAALSIMFKKNDQAVNYYQQAIKLQAQAKDVDAAAQDRLIKKLSLALSLRNQISSQDDAYHVGRISEADRSIGQQRFGSRRRKLLDRNSDVQPNRLRQIPDNVTVVDGPTSSQYPPEPMPRKPVKEPVIIKKQALQSMSRDKAVPPPKPYRRGRRDYGNNVNRPMVHVARGLSSLTDFSLQTRDSVVWEIDSGDDQDEERPNVALFGSSDEETTAERVPNNILYKGAVYSVSPSAMQHITRKIKNVADSGKLWRRHGEKLHVLPTDSRISEVQDTPNLFEEPSSSKIPPPRPKSAPRRPKDPNSSMSSKEKFKNSEERDEGLLSASSDNESDSDKNNQEVSPREDLDETDYFGEYRKQMETVDAQDDSENEDGRNTTEDSSSSSSSEEESRNEDKVGATTPKSMPIHTAPKPPLQEASILKQTYEKPQGQLSKDASPLYTKSMKSLRFSPNTKSPRDSTHLYETLSTPKVSSEDPPGPSEENIYDEPATTSFQRTDSFSSSSTEIPPLSTLMKEDSTEATPSSKTPPSKPKRRLRSANDTLPEAPIDKEDSSKTSKACSIM